MILTSKKIYTFLENLPTYTMNKTFQISKKVKGKQSLLKNIILPQKLKNLKPKFIRLAKKQAQLVVDYKDY